MTAIYAQMLQSMQHPTTALCIVHTEVRSGAKGCGSFISAGMCIRIQIICGLQHVSSILPMGLRLCQAAAGV